MAWGFIITPETFNYIVSENALQCAKVVLEGKASELGGHRANPNYMNPYGYFPLHEAAERFSVDMIKLLFKYGASANVRTAGSETKENLLPFHAAVEDTCLHKYLEDNLFPCQDHRNYIYNLIQLLCLSEMKIFLDTTRLLARKTNNLLDELWNYVEDGKLVQTAKMKGICMPDGFETIMARMMKHLVALKWGIGENRMAPNLETSSVLDCIALLVDLISRSGEALDAYIQTHSEAPHVEVLEHVSSILKDHGFSCNGEGIDITNLLARAGNLEHTRNSFFPYWRSVLLTNVDVTVFPDYAAADPKYMLNLNKQHPIVLLLVGRTQQATSYHTCSRPFGTPSGRTPLVTSSLVSRRLFGTAAFTLLKVLKNNA
ncbi:hypothetical protein BS78_02G001400 [Paspalum vaginatum]|nr:hypothetical protein BS78_02G001400 [Paspalum vaginatum]